MKLSKLLLLNLNPNQKSKAATRGALHFNRTRRGNLIRVINRHVALEGGGQGDMHLFAFIALVTRLLLDAGAQHDKELDLSSSVSAPIVPVPHAGQLYFIACTT